MRHLWSAVKAKPQVSRCNIWGAYHLQQKKRVECQMEHTISGIIFRKLWSTFRGIPLFPNGTELSEFSVPFDRFSSFQSPYSGNRAIFGGFIDALVDIFLPNMLYQCSNCQFIGELETFLHHSCSETTGKFAIVVF